MKTHQDDSTSALRRQAAATLRRARRLPVGPYRNDLRQLAIGLLWLERNGGSPNGSERMDSLKVKEDH
jgi:hypothetical protein